MTHRNASCRAVSPANLGSASDSGFQKPDSNFFTSRPEIITRAILPCALVHHNLRQKATPRTPSNRLLVLVDLVTRLNCWWSENTPSKGIGNVQSELCSIRD